jgi:hypothetical protein
MEFTRGTNDLKVNIKTRQSKNTGIEVVFKLIARTQRVE